MEKKSKTKEIIRILESIEPKIEMNTEGFEFNHDKHGSLDYSPPKILNWEDLIKILKEKKLEITFIKNKSIK